MDRPALSPRAVRALRRAAHGWPVKAIAAKEGVSPATVKHDLAVAREQLDAPTSAVAWIRWASRRPGPSEPTGPSLWDDVE